MFQISQRTIINIKHNRLKLKKISSGWISHELIEKIVRIEFAYSSYKSSIKSVKVRYFEQGVTTKNKSFKSY